MMQQILITSQPGAALSRYYAGLSGCRFCPMCKVAGEVSNHTMVESHSTRARAMMLWRSRHELNTLSARQVELLYQSTLDSISEAWCISHAPVSSYVAEARAAIYEAGLAPDAVLTALKRLTPESTPAKASVILLAGEAAELGDVTSLNSAVALLRRNCRYEHIEILASANGALAYCLGARNLVRRQAEQIVDRINSAGATEVIADGPQTLWALRRIYPFLGVNWPEGVTISSLSEKLAETLVTPASAASQNGNGSSHHHSRPSLSALFLDSRSACLLADSMTSGIVIQPGFRGPETALGSGEVFDAPRRLIDSLGINRVFHFWSRSLAKTSGADDGLWLTYPALADGLARQRLREARQHEVDLLVTDSLLSARHLALNAESGDMRVRWLPDLVAELAT